MAGGALILIDSHALIWLDQDDPALGRSSRKLADEALRDGDLAVSAITFWEVAMLAFKGLTAMDIALERWRLDLIGAGLVELPLDGEIGLAAAQIVDLHDDPADRFILATARTNDAVLYQAAPMKAGIANRPSCFDRLSMRASP